MQIKRLAKCQQLFAEGFSTDADTLQLLLGLERERKQSARQLSKDSLKRASIFEVATATLGPQRRHTGPRTLPPASDPGSEEALERKRRRSSRKSVRVSMAGVESQLMSLPGEALSADARRASRVAPVNTLLQRMATCEFVNPALLSTEPADTQQPRSPVAGALTAACAPIRTFGTRADSAQDDDFG